MDFAFLSNSFLTGTKDITTPCVRDDFYIKFVLKLCGKVIISSLMLFVNIKTQKSYEKKLCAICICHIYFVARVIYIFISKIRNTKHIK